MFWVDLFAFGGGFASLPLMLNEVVVVRSWMDYQTFMSGIALGQITPGPIVITAAFVLFCGINVDCSPGGGDLSDFAVAAQFAVASQDGGAGAWAEISICIDKLGLN